MRRSKKMSGKKITLRDVLQLSRLRQHVYILKDEQLIIAGICSQIYRRRIDLYYGYSYELRKT